MLGGCLTAFRQWYQHLFLGVNEGCSVITGEFEPVTVRNRVRWARFHTITAEDTAVVVDVVYLRVPLTATKANHIRVLCSFDINAVRWTSRCAKKARDTFFQPVLIALQNVSAAITILQLRRAVEDRLL